MTALTIEPRFDRRQLPDRRRQATTLWQALRGRGRRRGFRRAGEGTNVYVDRVAPLGAGLALMVFTASALDAWLTLLYLAQGGQEANPFMAFVLQYGAVAFVVVKMALTGLGVWLLAAHQQFALARKGLQAVAAMYLLLMGYHLWLIS